MSTITKSLEWKNAALRWTDSFAHKLADFEGVLWSSAQPTAHENPRLVGVSRAGAKLLGLSPELFWKDRNASAALWSGNELLPGMTKPWAQCYGGHQFGLWAGQLGDGRAINLGEIESDGKRWEVQLKGAGPTQYSRFADGFAVRRSSIREYLAAEHLHALGVPTSRSLALVFTDRVVQREEPELGAIVTRLAQSWVRFGSFELPASRGNHAACRRLADYVLEHNYPHIAGDTAVDKYTQLFKEITRRTAETTARWQSLGFCHGVMNTDNMSVLGLTIDYGPFAFIDSYDPLFICNRSDVAGRYAFSEQPRVALWNLLRLAAPFHDLIGNTEAIADILSSYSDDYRLFYTQLMRQKLGLFNVAKESDLSLVIEPLLSLLHRASADYTLSMRALCDVPLVFCHDSHLSIDSIIDQMDASDSDDDDHSWKNDMRSFLIDVYKPRLLEDVGDDAPSFLKSVATRMKQVNPRFILRNWVAQDVIDRAANGDDACIDRVLNLITTYAFSDTLPDDLKNEHAYGGPVPKWGQGLKSSCSS
ncbi:hypothetical protein EV175_000924 [Coemansia sp. RSA 1933]|nr:hypothetical protein EV175_000924 [Coemansia sp. RSA 1933]